MVMKIFNVFIEIIIIFSLMLFALETIPGLTKQQEKLLDVFEIITIMIFTIEYVIRFIKDKFKYSISFFGIVDLLSIVPFFIFFIPELSFVKILRLFRLFRMIKLARYASALRRVGIAIKEVWRELVVYIILNFCILYILAVIMYYIEGDVQPDKFGSIMHSLWWAVVTLTTIGYGDVVPATVAGKLITGFIAVLGIGVITIPTGLIASVLMKTRKEEKKLEKYERDPHLETIPDDGSIIVNENGYSEVDEKGKISGVEWDD
jgi:voltage-gated potassium channel